MRKVHFNRFSSLIINAARLVSCGVGLIGCTSLGLTGCSGQPELISPAAKAEPKDETTPEDAPAKSGIVTVSFQTESDAPHENVTVGSEPEKLNVADEHIAIAEAPGAPGVSGDTPVKSDAEVQTIAVQAPKKDKEVKPATLVVDVSVPATSGRSVLDGPAKIAKVLLTDAEKKICKVNVGDKVPNITLPSLAGEPTELNTLVGKKLTVITFWNPTDPYSTWQLSDLTGDVLKPFESLDVKVVSVCSGKADAAVDAATAQGAMDQAKAKFPCLLDADGSAMAQFGTDRTTRTYLIDAEGKVLWFDIDYSRSTRRELKSALSFLLEEQPPVQVEEEKPAKKTVKKASPAKKPATKPAPKSTTKPATKPVAK
jgi:peroxiredoxin